MELVALAAIGALFIWLGRKCLARYRQEFFQNPRLTMTRDLGSALTGSFSWGIAAGVLLFFGVAMCLLSGIVIALLLAANLGLFG